MATAISTNLMEKINTFNAKHNANMIRSFKTYGLTGQVILARATEDASEYDIWGEAEVPVKITGEYPKFLTGVVLTHMNQESGRESKEYPITIHKHDILIGAVRIRKVEGTVDPKNA